MREVTFLVALATSVVKGVSLHTTRLINGEICVIRDREVEHRCSISILVFEQLKRNRETILFFFHDLKSNQIRFRSNNHLTKFSAYSRMIE